MYAFGQINSPSTLTLTDTTGSETTLRSRGSYEVFVAAYDAADGSGKWAIDGGSDGLDYFFAFASDPDTRATSRASAPPRPVPLPTPTREPPLTPNL